MSVKSNEIKAGLVVVVSLIILGLFLVAIFGVNLGRETKSYYIYLEYLGGITEGSLVKYRGIDVGQVAEIILPGEEDNRIGLRIEVDKNTPIRVDSRAFLTSISLMSERHVEITAGSPDAELLPPGSVIPGKEAFSFAQMAESWAKLSARVEVLLDRINDALNEENRSHLSSVMQQMDALMKQSRDPLNQTVANLATLSREMTELSTNLNHLATHTGASLDSLLTTLHATTRVANDLIQETAQTVSNLETLTLSNQARITEIVDNLHVASQNLQEFSRLLKERPWMLVRKSAPPQRELPR